MVTPNMSLYIKKERDMRTILHSEEEKLLDIYYTLIKDSDSILIKQHIRVILYLTFIYSYHLYKTNMFEFLQKIKLTKKYFRYNFYYMYNEVNQNFPPVNINYKMINAFINQDSYSTNNSSILQSDNFIFGIKNTLSNLPSPATVNWSSPTHRSGESLNSYSCSMNRIWKSLSFFSNKKIDVNEFSKSESEFIVTKYKNEVKNSIDVDISETKDEFIGTKCRVLRSSPERNVMEDQCSKYCEGKMEHPMAFAERIETEKNPKWKVEKIPISTLIYEKIKQYSFKKQKEQRNISIVNDYSFKIKLNNVVINNSVILNDIKKQTRNVEPLYLHSLDTNNSFSSTLRSNEKTNNLYSNTTSDIFNYNLEEQRIKNEICVLNKHIQLSKNVLLDINNLKNNFECINNISKKLLEDKKKEIKYILDKNHCKRTILLDIDILKKYLNEDTINYIKEFVGKRFIKDTRRALIQKRYNLCEKKKIENILYLWSLKDLLNFEETHIYLKFNMKGFNQMGFYEYEPDDFLLMYNDLTIGDMFINESVKDKVQTKIKVINRILSISRIDNYFPFQRNVWLITNKMLSLSERRL
jgi:curved DNA-binding protein CbpA